MKKAALQLANQIVCDSKEYIDGNIAEYMIQEVESCDNNFFQYLTDDEIEKVESNKEEWSQLKKNVVDMLRDNFDYELEGCEY